MTTEAGIDIPIPRPSRAVRLRCGLSAVVWRVAVEETWTQLGIDVQGYVHAWTALGRWSDTEFPHPFDIEANLVPSK